MWQVYSLSKLGHKRPSDIVGITDLWLMYQFDSAVSLVGVTIENALHETVENLAKQHVPKYELNELLKPNFKFPKPLTDTEKEAKSVDYFRGMLGVKWYKAKKVDNQ